MKYEVGCSNDSRVAENGKSRLLIPRNREASERFGNREVIKTCSRLISHEGLTPSSASPAVYLLNLEGPRANLG